MYKGSAIFTPPTHRPELYSNVTKAIEYTKRKDVTIQEKLNNTERLFKETTTLLEGKDSFSELINQLVRGEIDNLKQLCVHYRMVLVTTPDKVTKHTPLKVLTDLVDDYLFRLTPMEQVTDNRLDLEERLEACEKVIVVLHELKNCDLRFSCRLVAKLIKGELDVYACTYFFDNLLEEHLTIKKSLEKLINPY